MQPRVCAVGKEFASIKGKEGWRRVRRDPNRMMAQSKEKKHNLEKKQQE